MPHLMDSLAGVALRAIATTLIAAPLICSAQTPPPRTDLQMQPRPGAGLTLVPAPTVTRMQPDDFVVQGDTLRIVGQFVPHELVLEIDHPAVRIDIIGRSLAPAQDGTSWVIARFPPNYVSPPAGAPLRGHHGITGASATLRPTWRVVPKPTATLRILSAPAIELRANGSDYPTTLEVALENYVPGLKEPYLRYPDCEPSTNRQFRPPERQTAGNPHRVLFEEHFGVEYAGRRCTVELHPYSFLGTTPPTRYSFVIGQVQLPAIDTYVIDNTAELLDHTTPSGKKLQAGGHNGPLPCQLASVGTAGSFSTGVVRSGGDLTFQLRNGLFTERCEFTTSPGLEMKRGWLVKKVNWSFDETSLCRAEEFAYQQPDGALVSVFRNDTFIYPIRFQATCNTNADDLPRNSHRYLARLTSVELLGPPGKTWKDAFK